MGQPEPDRRVPVYTSKTDVVCTLMREMIVSGEVGPGQQLKQRDLAARFGVSQTPIREALRRLEAEGLVVNDINRGATVALSRRTAAEDHGQVRASLESLAARLAAQQITAEEVDELRSMNAIMAVMNENHPGYAAANQRFHFKICEYARTPILMSLMRMMWQSILLGPMSTRAHRESWLQHERLIDALAAHDGQLAARIVYEHVLGHPPEGDFF